MREEGYYWVKFKYHPWQIAFYNGSKLFSRSWTIIGNQDFWKDSDFEEIDERRIERNG